MKKYLAGATIMALVLVGAAAAGSNSKPLPTKHVHHFCFVVDPRGGATGHDMDTSPNHVAPPRWRRVCVSGLRGKKGTNGANGLNGSSGSTGATGPAGPAGPAGPKGNTGNTGPQGPAGPAGPTTFENTRECTADLCIDADPASGGSGGWGFDQATNSNVTDLTKGQTYTFTATVVQDNNQAADGSITLTWNPNDFTGPTTGADTSASCTTASTGNAMTCDYTDLAHQYKSDSFQFTAVGDNPDAQVGVTVRRNCDGQQAYALFPVEISG